MQATVYGLAGSHPVKAALLMLDRKGIEWKRRDLANVVDRPLLRMMGFPGPTVPAIKLDGRKIQTTRAIARALDELVPEPPLFPADPARRAAVEDAERWGDEVLQPVPRRLSWGALTRDRSGLRSFVERPIMGIPPAIAVATAAPLVYGSARVNKATDDAVRADLMSLPALIDQVDDLIGNGVIGGSEPNAADFQIFPSVRLLLCFDDLRPLLEGRPAAEHAMRVVPDFPGRIPPVYPAEWLPVPAVA
ncbi:MAG TPA: glutathione S-transferase N-terminal domain-containing protein [Solirubrobacterales bacterium]|nr:glutathione S-transferase N-terminal domain-containing protein [Solirubrobacterales bacterium]